MGEKIMEFINIYRYAENHELYLIGDKNIQTNYLNVHFVKPLRFRMNLLKIITNKSNIYV